MAWFARIDRYASVHLVRSQDTVMQGGSDSSNSCGIASILMVNFKMKKHLLVAGVAAGARMSASPIGGQFIGAQLASAAINQAVKTEPEVYKVYTAVTGSAYDGSSYSDGMQFPAVLRKLSLGDWECVNVGQTGMFDAIVAATDDGSPVIVHCAWNGGGAHFMVVDETHTTIGSSICVCDPWDGELRLVSAKSGAAIAYDPNAFVWSFSLGGNRHAYDTASPGTLSGWIIRRK
jgi:hypothetical protein